LLALLGIATALMRISMEGNDKLSDSDLDTLVDKFKNKKDRYMML
jgi:hypothetical protein